MSALNVHDLRDQGQTRPRKVFDVFLQRFQTRVITDYEFLALLQPMLDWYKLNTAVTPDVLVGSPCIPEYGSRAWAGGRR